MRRVFSWAVAFLLVSTTSVFAAVADWAEEMTVLPYDSDKNWLPGEGDPADDWGADVTLEPGGTWKNTFNAGNMYTQGNPMVSQQKFTVEYKFRFTATVPAPEESAIFGGFFYSSGAGGNNSDQMLGRTRHQFGYFPGGADLNFEVVGAGENRHNREDLNGDTPYYLANEWKVVRVILDNTATPPYMSMYLNDSLVKTVSHQSGNSLFVGEDDIDEGNSAGLAIGSQDGGQGTETEWDYIRIKTSVVPISEALNAAGCGGDVSGSTVGVPDGTTDGADLAYLYNNWGTVPVGTLGDIAGTSGPDGIVDGADVGKIYNCWAQADGGPAPAVPEPASLGILGLGMVGLLAARRR